MSEDVQEVELAIYTSDDSEIDSLVRQLEGLEVQRPRRARVVDPMVIISVASAGVTLINSLLDLRDRLMSRAGTPEVVVRNERGDSISLAHADDKDIKRVVEGSSGAEVD